MTLRNMDIGSTTSLRDRINALNLNKVQQLSPQKQKTSQTRAEKTPENDTSFPAKPLAKPRAQGSTYQKTDAVKAENQKGSEKPKKVEYDAGTSYRNGPRSLHKISTASSNVGRPISPVEVSKAGKPTTDRSEEISSPGQNRGYTRSPSEPVKSNKATVESVYMVPRRSLGDISDLDQTEYSATPRNIPVYGADDDIVLGLDGRISPDVGGLISARADFARAGSSGASIYSATPNNIPAKLVGETKNGENAFQWPILQGPNPPGSNLPRHVGPNVSRPNSPMVILPEQNCDSAESNVYNIPRNTESGPDPNDFLPEDISSRWQNLRRTVKDRHLRQMVDMTGSEIDAMSPSFTVTSELGDIEDSDVIKASYGRSQSLADNLYSPERKGSRIKRPSLPATYETPPSIEFESNPFSPVHRFSPDSDISRRSSAKSTTSSTASEFGRPRNESNVSVTLEENNYVAFESLPSEDGLLLAPNERTLVIVKGDTEFSGKLTLAMEPESQSMAVEDNPRASSPLEDIQSEGKKKGKKLNVFGKLTKAVKTRKKSSPFASSTSATMPPRKFPQSPGRNMTSSPRHVTPLSPRVVTSRPEGVTSPPTPARRPPSHVAFTNLKSFASEPSLATEEEGVYYDPATQNESDDELMTVVGVINEDDYVTEDIRDVRKLTANKRSQSMASLASEIENLGHHRKMSETIGERRKLSDDFGSYRTESEAHNENEYLVSSAPPVPPPKYKSLRKRAEKQALEEATYVISDVSSVTSQEMTSANGQDVQLRQSKFTFEKERQNWPGGRPPSMPFQGPPSPPRPESMPSNSPPVPLSPPEEEDENEYIAPTCGQSSPDQKTSPGQVSPSRMAASDTSIPKPSFNGRPAQPKLPAKPKPPLPAPMPPSQTQASAPSPADDDSIYHTVDDNPVVREVTIGQPRFEEQAGNGAPNGHHPRPFLSELMRKTNPDTGIPDSRNQSTTATNSTATKPTPAQPGKPDTPKRTGLRPAPKRPVTNPPTIPKKDYTPGKPGSRNGYSVKSDTPPVKPPPRLVKLAKTQSKPELLPGYQDSSGGKNRSESASVAELGKILSLKSPMSPPSLRKTTPPSPKSNREAGQFPVIPEYPDTPPKPGGEKPEVPRLPPKPSEPSRPSKPPPPAPKTTPDRKTSPTSTTTSSMTSLSTRNTLRTRPTEPTPTAVIIRRHAETLPTSSVTSSDMIASALRPASKRRPPAKRPTVPPPPRPNVPPPPRPDASTKQQTKQNGLPPKGRTNVGKAAPPSRPPPLSSDKIKAAEERRKQLASKASEEDECEYSDHQLKHEEDMNTYAAIDDDAFVFQKSGKQTAPMPTPPVRSKLAKRFGSKPDNSKWSKQKAGIVDARMKTKTSIVAPQGVYNGEDDADDDEGVYAGIDDFPTTPQKSNVIIASRKRNGNFT